MAFERLAQGNESPRRTEVILNITFIFVQSVFLCPVNNNAKLEIDFRYLYVILTGKGCLPIKVNRGTFYPQIYSCIII